MSNSTKLLDHLIKVKNLSGAIKPAPQALKKLKESIKGVPFELMQPGMSGVMDLQKIMQGLAQFVKQFGGLGQVGNFGNLMGRFQGQAKDINQLSKLDSNMLSSKISVDEVTKAMGDAGAFSAALTQFSANT